MTALYFLGAGVIGFIIGVLFMLFYISIAFRSFILEPWNAPPPVRQAIRSVIDCALQASQAAAHTVQEQERCPRDCGEKVAGAIGDMRLDVWERAFKKQKIKELEDEAEEVESKG